MSFQLSTFFFSLSPFSFSLFSFRTVSPSLLRGHFKYHRISATRFGFPCISSSVWLVGSIAGFLYWETCTIPIEPQLIVFHSFNKHFLLCLSSYLRFPHSNIITKYSHSINVMFGIPPHIFIKRLFILRQMCAKYIKLCYEVDMSISKIY